MHKLIVDLIPNDWKQELLWTETSQKLLLKTICYNNKDTRKRQKLQRIF